MSRKYASQLALEVRPSGIYRQLVISVGLLSGIAIVIISGEYPLTGIFACLFLIIYMAVIWKKNQLVMLQSRHDGRWRLKYQNTETIAQLSGNSVITPFLSVLIFKKQQGGVYYLPLFIDSLHREDYRRLRLKLKVEGMHTDSRDKITP